MQKFLEEISSPYWWIGVVFVGIVINIISAYLKSRLDAYLGNVSKWWAKKNQEDKERFDREVDKIKQNPELLNLALFDEMRARIKGGNYIILFAVIFFAGIFSPVLNGISIFKIVYFAIILILWQIGFNSWSRANEIKSQITIALKNQNKKEE